ncbi:S-adenosyl-L-methionine-dependent methyltransferase [Durotheca rogersii]|uniref:S-adenosyl-L-methionine-dependent methyltransferase n=1 Tax=Durotheca rogersii TaxID=419775 RepID=UPI00221EDB81|nr:S-adenosyl-L-methionine-dependent methyltransferase [Durotheca rogersii]KAI5862271.1 S-adenosyl-L-methionine-dependent methyltransferase [Durotheca rogersii]
MSPAGPSNAADDGGPRRPPRPRGDPDDSDSEDDSDWSEGGGEQEEADDDDEAPEVISLLDDRVFPDVLSMLAHCRQKHHFDFLSVRQRLQLDFHGCVKLVNFIRQRVHEGLPVTEDISWADIDHEQYLKPVLDDDAVILGLFDLPEVRPTRNGAGAGAGAAAAADDDAALVDDLLRRNGELQDELARVRAQFDSYRAAVQKTLDERLGDAEASVLAEPAARKPADKEDESKYYWDSYGGPEIHEEMLKDTVRTDAYRDFIYNNKHLFAGKTVLDVGCGTGILSMFCARAGASRVFAVDASAIISKARENVQRNGLASTVVCLSGRVEEVALPVAEVDVIVSEWMGYCLLFEAMLPSVLWARDRYLAPGGLLVPSHASLWLAPVADPDFVADTVGFWRHVYGFDMRAMQAGIYDEARVLRWDGPSSGSGSGSAAPAAGGGGGGAEDAAVLAGAPTAFKLFDLYETTAADLAFTAPFASALSRDVDALDGFLVWFDIFFSAEGRRRGGKGAAAASPSAKAVVELDASAAAWARADQQNRAAFTTGPHGAPTHWKQGLLLVKPAEEEEAREASGTRQAEEEEKQEEEAQAQTPGAPLPKGREVAGQISFAPLEDHARGLSIRVAWDGGAREQTWALR